MKVWKNTKRMAGRRDNPIDPIKNVIDKKAQTRGISLLSLPVKVYDKRLY